LLQIYVVAQQACLVTYLMQTKHIHPSDNLSSSHDPLV